MNAKRLLIIGLLVALVGCSHTAKIGPEMAGTYAPVEASLTNINQKVASHFIRGIPVTFDKDEYVATINEVCRSNPVCLSEAKKIFESYGVKARKVDDMFSVMLCDEEMKWKVMEDFSCNSLRVEVQSWKSNNEIPCEFEDNWAGIAHKFCNN